MTKRGRPTGHRNYPCMCYVDKDLLEWIEAQRGVIPRSVWLSELISEARRRDESREARLLKKANQ
jgi:hypothetical protein